MAVAPANTLFFSGDRWACQQKNGVWSTFKNQTRPTKHAGVWKNRPDVRHRPSGLLRMTPKISRTAHGRWQFKMDGRVYQSVENDVIVMIEGKKRGAEKAPTGDAIPATGGGQKDTGQTDTDEVDTAAIIQDIRAAVAREIPTAAYYPDESAASRAAIEKFNLDTSHDIRRFAQGYAHRAADAQDGIDEIAYNVANAARKKRAGASVSFTVTFPTQSLAQVQVWIV